MSQPGAKIEHDYGAETKPKRGSESSKSLRDVANGTIKEIPEVARVQMRDIGAELYLEVQQYSREELDRERAVVRRKLDWVIMPIV